MKTFLLVPVFLVPTHIYPGDHGIHLSYDLEFLMNKPGK